MVGWPQAGRQEECVLSPTEILFSGQFQCGMKASSVQVSFNKKENSRQGLWLPSRLHLNLLGPHLQIPLTSCYILAFKTKALVCFVT